MSPVERPVEELVASQRAGTVWQRASAWGLTSAETDCVVDRIRRDVRAFVSDQELGLLYEVARGLHGGDPASGHVVELGTKRGGTACALAMGVRDGGGLSPVLTVDCYPREDPSASFDHIAAREAFWTLGLGPERVCQVITYTGTFLRMWNRPIRVLFHDPSHVYENTRDEIAAALPNMVEDSWIIFDDFGGPWGEGVIRAVEEWLAIQQEWKVELRHSDAYMLGVHLIRRV
jgi:hypothetical protein